MPLINSFRTNTTSNSKPRGTLTSEGIYHQPNVPNQSSAGPNFKGADGRAYTRTVQDNELVRNQLTDLLADDSKYITNARQRGVEQANKRGMLNSSIAAGSSERAAIEAGMPIASQDAQTYGRAASENLGFLNQNLMQERDVANRMLANKRDNQTQMAGYSTQERMNSANLAGQLQRQRENLAYSGEQAGLDRAHDFGMLGADYSFRNQFADNDVLRQDWMANQDFGRGLYAAVAGQRITNASQFFNYLSQAAIDDPTVWDPQALSGFSQFWEKEIFGPGMDDLFDDIFSGWNPNGQGG